MNEKKAPRLPRIEVQDRIAKHAEKKLQVVRTSVRAGVAMYGVAEDH